MMLHCCRPMPVVLPHELIHALDSAGRLKQLCPQHALKEFWEHFRSEASAEVPWPKLSPPGHPYPLGLHGDDCRYTDTGEKLLVVTCNLLLDDSQLRFPLVAMRCVSRRC